LLAFCAGLRDKRRTIVITSPPEKEVSLSNGITAIAFMRTPQISSVLEKQGQGLQDFDLARSRLLCRVSSCEMKQAG
jgi:hypothetical protein